MYRQIQTCKSICFVPFSVSPTPQVEWVKIGHQLPANAKVESHGKLLVVPRVEQDDSGKYMCKAKNRLGEVFHYFTVTVEGNYIVPSGCSAEVHLTIIDKT